MIALFLRFMHYLFCGKAKEKERYAKNWPEISRRYRARKKWTCERCKVNLKRNRNLLHCHHRNRNPRDNRRRNLRALCIVCHSQQAGRGHRQIRRQAVKNGNWAKLQRIRTR